MASTSKESYGIASYAISRHRKNKVFMWQSRVQHGRVYEFLLASRFKVPGLVSWKCMHCMQIREKMKRQMKPVKDLKIPLVLIDNDVIRENPDKPLNAQHFCKEWAANDGPLEVSIDRFSDTVLEAVPLDLDAVQKKQMKQCLDEKCERVMKKVLRKRKREVHKDYPSQSARMAKRMELSNDYYDDDGNLSTEVVVRSYPPAVGENEYIDVG
ncbi:unnamed protein product [Angiostrongylus costaricensis]|uniref:Zinc finger protein n=1 Tax=Angiostrongylus costaricensis TaxID=334426 RepID=A0A0R3PZT8_ANGCS|nr:unnamed protein product [Angiostrongylus costaricensis]